MNITEKRRAEEMVREWSKAASPTGEPAPAPPQEVTAAIAEIDEAFKRAKSVGRKHGFRVSFVNYGKGELRAEEDPNSTQSNARRKRDEAARDQHARRRDDLISRVWNGDFSFETLRAELTK